MSWYFGCYLKKYFGNVKSKSNNNNKKLVGLSSPELTLVDLPLMDEPTRNSLLKSNVRLKQEKNEFH